MGHITVKALQCDRCQHIWLPRDAKKPPLQCPKCHSPYWDMGPVGRESVSAAVRKANTRKKRARP